MLIKTAQGSKRTRSVPAAKCPRQGSGFGGEQLESEREALGLLRIEKGHVAGSELNGQTTAADLGLGKMVKRRGDFVGRALLARP